MRVLSEFGQQGGGLIVTPSALTATRRDLIISLAARFSLPAIYSFMRKLLLAAASIALTASMMTLVTPAQARGTNWCSRHQGQLHCMYHSHAQCQASVSGGRGYCVRNPHSA